MDVTENQDATRDGQMQLFCDLVISRYATGPGVTMLGHRVLTSTSYRCLFLPV